MDKLTAMKQWAFCVRCGAPKVQNPKIPDDVWLVCPVELPYWLGLTKVRTYCPQVAVLVMPFAHGTYYRGKCRNAQVARYNAETNKFVYMREKFGSVFAEDIGHAENDDGFDIFEPYTLMEIPPFEIPLVAR
jgi:hypothetical protein